VTWAAWRVQRPQLLAAMGAVVLLGLWLAATALAMGHSQNWKYWTDGDVYVLYALPGLVGLTLGVPLVAGEIDRGTNRLAWTQSVTRARWLAVKLAVGGLVTAALVAALAAVLNWWTRAISLAASTDSGGFSGVRIQPSGFDLSGMVIIGYAAFAFALGAALGAIIRRAGWAFAVGVPAFAACRLVIEDWIRPHLVAPATYANLTGAAPQAVWNSWVLNSGLLPAGRTSPAPGQAWSAAPPAGYSSCIEQAKTNGGMVRCAVQAHVHYVIQFQPDSHYWPLQGAETAIFAILAAALIGVTVTVVRRWTA
jgi:ABC-type transport system involved in multi-copper enzyme maturation permease subunit